MSLSEQDLHGGAKTAPPLRTIMLLEVSQYLELYLWPHYDDATATPQHVLSIAAMVVEKARENVPAWNCFTGGPSEVHDAAAGCVTPTCCSSHARLMHARSAAWAATAHCRLHPAVWHTEFSKLPHITE